jgi:hypothetical protein
MQEWDYASIHSGEISTHKHTHTQMHMHMHTHTNKHTKHHNTHTPHYAILTYLITPWFRVPLKKLTSLQLVKKFPAFYGTRRFITTFTSAATCPYPKPDQSNPYPQVPLPEDPSLYYPPIYAYTTHKDADVHGSRGGATPHHSTSHHTITPHAQHTTLHLHNL